MKRVLIITQRWLKMSKYLPEYGWQPVIYTTENAEYPIIDPTLEKDVCPEAEVIRRPIVEPYNFYKKFLGINKQEKVKVGFASESKKSGWKEKLSVWIRGNCFIPDARCWWVNPSVKYLKEYLRKYPVDAIISTGPPHSMHLIAMKLKKATGLTWIADFRDPWTEIDFYDELHLTRWADRKQHKLEHQVLTQADKVVTVGWDWARGLGRLGNRNVRVIQNGYDWDCNPNEERAPLSKEFSLTHLGVVAPSRNAPVLWQALQELKNEIEGFGKTLKIKLVGQVDQSVIENLTSCGLMENIELITQVPHDEVKRLQEVSQVLLLLVNNTPNAKGILTGKLYEYLASRRPILAIGPENGDAARLIHETRAGVTVGFDEKDKMKEVINKLYQSYLEDGIPDNPNEGLEQYSRKALARKYATLLYKNS